MIMKVQCMFPFYVVVVQLTTVNFAYIMDLIYVFSCSSIMFFLHHDSIKCVDMLIIL